uniref:Uncharacterized protein n=1 Tax=Timema shepardi TaxID=629360 RepID=A0A7R9FZT5_TIMSH|nr:unnamed protein product [Timema shepardi]
MQMYVNPTEYMDMTVKSESPDAAEPESICGLPSMVEEHGWGISGNDQGKSGKRSGISLVKLSRHRVIEYRHGFRNPDTDEERFKGDKEEETAPVFGSCDENGGGENAPKRRVEDHGQDGRTERRRTRKLKELTGDARLTEKLGKIDSNGRRCARRPAEAETSNN